MKNGFTAGFQNCATCDFWTGLRNLNSTRTRVEYNSGVEGDCLYGGRKITRRPPTAKCSNYQKWGQLKSIVNSARKGKKGTIPYPIFVGLILLVPLLQFIVKNKEIFIVIATILVFMGVLIFFFYKKYKKQKYESPQNEGNQNNAVENGENLQK